MLESKNRLKKEKDFQSVFEKGRGVREDGLFFKMQQRGEGAPRLGVVVSKKVSKKAVDRNRIRRVIQAQAREHMKRMKDGVDGVIVVLPEFRETTPRGLAQVINTLFTKASILQ